MEIKLPVLFRYLVAQLLTLPFKTLIWDHFTAWQLCKLSFSTKVPVFPPCRLTFDPNTYQLVKLNCYFLFLWAHTFLPAWYNLQKAPSSLHQRSKSLLPLDGIPGHYFWANKQLQFYALKDCLFLTMFYTTWDSVVSIHITNIAMMSQGVIIWPSKGTPNWGTCI